MADPRPHCGDLRLRGNGVSSGPRLGVQTRNTRTEGCPQRASQPWEQTCLLGEQGSPQRTVQGSRATVDAVSHLGPSDKDGGLRVTGMSRKGHTWPVGRGGLSAVRRVLIFPPSCAREGVRAPCSRVWCPHPGPSAGLCLFSFTPRGFSFNSECAPGCDRRVLTRGRS